MMGIVEIVLLQGVATIWAEEGNARGRGEQRRLGEGVEGK